LARTDEQLKNFRRLAGHLHEYRALSTPQHARQTPLLSVQSERLQCAPTMAESCTPKAEIRRRAKFDLLLSHLIGDRECPLPRPKSVLSASLDPGAIRQHRWREEILQIFGDCSTDLPATADNHGSSCVPNTFGWRSGEAPMTTPAFLVELK